MATLGSLEMSTFHHVMLILFFSYIYENIRLDYFSSRRERYEELDQEEFEQKSKQKQRSYNGEQQFSSSSRLEANINMRKTPPLRRRVWKLNDSLEGSNNTTPTAPSTTKTNLQDKYRRCYTDDELTEDDCPLIELPKILKWWKQFSTCYVLYSFVRYICICLLQFQLVNVDPIYSCYLPGRLAFVFDLAYELPLYSLIIISYHVIYRYLWCVVHKRINIDCFLFVACKREDVERRELQLHKLNNAGDSLETRKLYAKDYMFYQKVRQTFNQSIQKQQKQTKSTANSREEVRYVMRCNRTVEHWKLMRQFVVQISYFCIVNFTVFGVPVVLVIIFNLISNEYFAKHYPFCQSFAENHRPSRGFNVTLSTETVREVGENFEWTFDDPFRLTYFFLDIIDNSILLLDSSCGMTWPFTAAIICTHDLTLRIRCLRQRLLTLSKRVDDQRGILDSKGERSSLGGATFSSTKPSQDDEMIKRKLANELSQEIVTLHCELVDTFKQVDQVDKFMAYFSAFCIFCWVLINICYQVMSLSRHHLLFPNIMVQFFQCLGLILLTFTFSFMSRPHSETIKLYTVLCSVMARDPNIDTTMESWAWILEYYYTTRFTLHLGYRTPLSMANYLKCIAWFVSCALMVISLFKIVA